MGRAIKKFFSGWRRRRSLISRRNENFDLHVRNRRFISKLICEGLVGGGCRGKNWIYIVCYSTKMFLGTAIHNTFYESVNLKVNKGVIDLKNASSE